MGTHTLERPKTFELLSSKTPFNWQTSVLCCTLCGTLTAIRCTVLNFSLNFSNCSKRTAQCRTPSETATPRLYSPKDRRYLLSLFFGNPLFELRLFVAHLRRTNQKKGSPHDRHKVVPDGWSRTVRLVEISRANISPATLPL